MKKQSVKKLVLAKETLQKIESLHLGEAYGGGIGDTGTTCPSRGIDTVQACC